MALNVKEFKNSIKDKGMLEESTFSSQIGLDKFGRKRDLVLEEYKRRSLRPRDLLNATKG